MAWPLLLLLGALALLPPAAWPSPTASNSSAAPTEVTLAVVLPERNLRYFSAWPRVGPALSLALEALQPELREAGLSVRPVFASSEEEKGVCSDEAALQSTVQLKVFQHPDVLLGLGCDFTPLLTESSAALWGLPLLTAGDHSKDRDFSTMVYAGPTGHGLLHFLALLHWRFNWTSPPVFAVHRRVQDFQRHFYELRRANLGLDSRNVIYEHADEALRFIRANGRVVYIYGSPETLQQTMHLAQAQKMTNGDYVFIYLDILGESLEADGLREAAKPWQSKESHNPGGLQEAFQTVLIITSHKPQTPEYRHFQSQLILRAQRDFGVVLNNSLHKNLVAGCFHDGLLVYIRALNETLREGGTKRDTSRILEKMRGLKIQGITGTVSMNSYRVREMDFDLWSMADVESGEYQVVGQYMGSKKRIKWLGPIHWKKRGPPLDNPPCVFDMDDPSCGGGSVHGIREADQMPRVDPLEEGGAPFNYPPRVFDMDDPSCGHGGRVPG